jgi:hypothetical protein
MKNLDLIPTLMSLSIQGCNGDISIYLGKNLEDRDRDKDRRSKEEK